MAIPNVHRESHLICLVLLIHVSVLVECGCAHTREGFGSHLQVAGYVDEWGAQHYLWCELAESLVFVLCSLKPYEVGMYLRLDEAFLQNLSV